MREIEFRGINNFGEWVYGSYVKSDNIFPAIYFEVGKGSMKKMDWKSVKLKSVGQYTGLKDKNGVKIFESDYLMPGWSVTWGGDQGAGLGMNAGWYVQRDDFESWMELESRCNENKNNWEVIGNLHQNPELLKEGN